jgi:signal transduction histidine kinase
MILVAPANATPVIRRRGPDRGHLEELVLRQAREATGMRVYGSGPRRASRPGWSAAHVPVLLSGEQVATLSALRVGGDQFEPDECRALSRLAHLVALAWATEGYQRHLAESATAAERQRIADELHDHVAQLLFAARLSLDFALEMHGVPDAAAANVRRGRDLLMRADTATRQVMERNAQASESCLADRLAALVGSVEEEFARPVALEIAPAARDAVDEMGQSARNLIARAAREALVNAAKHAGPCQLAVRLTVTRRNRLLLTVTDGGIGVGVRREEGYGTAALRRAVRLQGGALRVNGIATGGTKVAVSLPI